MRQDAQDFARLVDYRAAYQPGARRFDAGGRTASELTPMATAALRRLTAWTVPRVSATPEGHHRPHLPARPAARSDRPGPHGPHMLGITVPAHLRQATARALQRSGVFVGARGGALRISPHLHTTTDALDTALAYRTPLLGSGPHPP